MLLTPAASLAQEARDIELGQAVSGDLGPGDQVQNGRAYDDYLYGAVSGTQARIVVRSRQMAADVSIYFYDDYFDLIPLIAGGSVPRDSVDFIVPDVDSPTLVVIRVTTRADDPGPGTGDYTIELSEVQDPSVRPVLTIPSPAAPQPATSSSRYRSALLSPTPPASATLGRPWTAICAARCGCMIRHRPSGAA